MSLFQVGEFVLRSGMRSRWRIECDSLTRADWDGIAAMAVDLGIVPLFGTVEGVPRGGLPLARAMEPYATPGHPGLLICEDVVTTGGSMERHRAGREVAGGLVFIARGRCPDWVQPVLIVHGAWAGDPK